MKLIKRQLGDKVERGCVEAAMANAETQDIPVEVSTK